MLDAAAAPDAAAAADASTADPQPLVSVVVTTYTLNRLADVFALLDSLKRQSYANLEIVFVAEGPRELAERVEAHAGAAGIETLRIVTNDGPAGLSPARNLGVRHSRGAIVAFIDDDAVAEPDWVESIVRTFCAHPEVIGVTGPAYPLWEDRSLQWWPEEFYWIVSCPTPGWLGFDSLRPVRNAWGMNMAYRREVFSVCEFSQVFIGGNARATDGAKLGLLGDDTEFCLRLARAIPRPVVFDPAVRVRHRVHPYRLTSRFVARRAFWEGYTKAVLRRQTASQDFALGPESALLRRILFRFAPKLLWRLIAQPACGWRQLRLAAAALACVALGFASGTLPGPFSPLTDRFAR